jgi:hypothetical protein
MATIDSKRKFYELWADGALGNRTQLFYTLDEAMASGVEKIGFRAMGRGGGAWERASRRADVPEIYARWKAAGRTFVMDDGVPNDKTRMQGELVRRHLGIEGFLAVGTSIPPMRQSIAAGMHRHYGYLETRVLLQQFMDPASRDDIDALFERYPDAAIEFACFSVNVGVIPGRNTMIWEVRNY